MKKLLFAVCVTLSALLFSTAAFADAALPPGYQLQEALGNVLPPVLIAVVIAVAGILIKVFKSRNRK